MERNFLQLYYRVFAEDGRMKFCGRQACIDLLEECFRLNGKPDDSLGDIKTGHLRYDAIRNFAFSVAPEIRFKETYLNLFDENGELKFSIYDMDHQNELSEFLQTCPAMYKKIFSEL